MSYKQPNPLSKNDIINPLISIIIPVYNVEQYLAKCIDSVINQTYTNLEILLIDDGSTDLSGDICDEYAHHDGRIKVEHLKNSGVSVARNTGISNSRGDFITFVDADDTLLPNAVETMAQLLVESEVDCVRTKCNEIKQGKSSTLKENIKPGIYRDNQKYELLLAAALGNMMCYSVLLMFKRDVLNKHSVRFPEGIAMMEDAWFCIDFINTVSSILISNEVTYNYLIHEASASRTIAGFSEKIESVISVNEHLNELPLSDEHRRHMNAVHMRIIASLFMVRADRLPRSDVYALLNIVADNKKVKQLYKVANLKYLPLYHRVAVWATANNQRLAVECLRFIRKVSRK